MASSADLTAPAASPLSVALVAGEPSGDLLAARLLSGLRPHLPEARFHGIGGEHMIAQGFESHWPMDKLTVRGLLAVIPRYREIKGIQNQLRDQLLAERPAAFIGADYPGFNLGLEEQLKAAGIPTIHYIGPQIWAWRGGRIKKIIKAVSHMLVVFPFEEEIYRQAGVPVTYVGHPLAELIPLAPDVAGARRALGIPEDANVVTIMPGSRMSELKYNTAAFIGAARLLKQRDRTLRFVTPMAGERQRQYFLELVAQAGLQDVEVQLLDGQSHTAIAAADAVLVASGTASLEVTLFKKPMVIAYRMMELEWQILRHFGYQPWIGLPNILAREFLVPELLQNAANPEALAEAMWKQLSDAPHRLRLSERFTDMHHSLLRNSAVESAAAVLKVIKA
ncbi:MULTISPECIES: lipid-A-disaccharide synthase [unclassified Duganella]|uniref:lipid-A-disaccharide synthase n=1 Tax=unclassified Duganella TaxID=2636909 RepID=UPI000E350B65|nr:MULTISPECIES: lipid-A-disaccharide synthase [unclassified Duganella]RFP19098.1 lipid-A-disaccharide synthase [Duganella sp. BJB475]RFP35760.1 lipid-A-disaccharide synthase [Duganella sp. BJB476]